ncbi:Arginase [Taenia solium]|eukprot:TsM_000352400 transcript=TsM_000352400 gene=TsM_000352400
MSQSNLKCDRLQSKLGWGARVRFDVDGLDPKYAPSTGTPVPGGLSLDENKYICKILGETDRLTLSEHVNML